MTRRGLEARLFAALLAAGLALTGLLAWRAQAANAEALAQATQALADKVADQTVAQVERAALGLRGARGYFIGSGTDGATASGFRRYVASRDLAREFPGVLGVGLIRRVAPSAQAAFVERMRRQGEPDFGVRSLQAPGDERRLVEFIEPLPANRTALGLDVASDPVRRDAADRALAREGPSLTAPLHLLQARPDASLGLVMMLRLPPDSATPAWGVGSGSAGLVFSPIQLDRLLEFADLRTELVSLAVADATDPATPLDFALARPPAEDGAARAGAVVVRQVMDRSWRFTVGARPALARTLPLRSPATVGAVGVAASLLLAALAALAARLRRRGDAHRSERVRLLTLIDNAGDAMISVDLQGRVTMWNRAAALLLGHPTDAALGCTLQQLALLPAPADEDERLRRAALEGRATPPIETQRRHRDGRLVDVELSAGPILDAGGHVVGVATVLRPLAERLALTRRLQAHGAELERAVDERTRALAALGNELRQLLDALPSRVGAWDRGLNSRLANRAYARSLGCSAEALHARRLPDLLGAPAFAGWQDHVAAALAGHEQRFEWTFERPDAAGMRHGLVTLVPQQVDGATVGFYELVHDVTELVDSRQAAAGALRERSTLLDALDRFAIVSVADRGGRIVSVNDPFCALSGYRRDELLGQNHRIVNSGTHGAAFWQAMWSTIAGGAAWRGEICNRAKDGTLYWVHSVVVPFFDDGGQIERYVSVRFDITPLKNSEQALRRGEAMLARTGRMAGVGGWALDLIGGTLHWSDETCRIHGVPPGHRPTLDEAIGHYAPEAQPVVRSLVQRAIDRREGWDTELRFLQADGTPIWVRALGEVELDGDRPVRLVGALQDVTVQRAARDALLRQQALTQSMLEAAPVAVRVARLRDNRVRAVNERFCQLVRRPHAACMDLDVAPFYVDAEAFADIRSRLAAGETVRERLVELRVPDQPEAPHAWVLATYMVTDFEGEPAVLAWLYDVTELQQAREAARQSKALLLQALEATRTGLAIYGVDDRLEMCNRRFVEMYADVAPVLVPGTPFQEIARAITARYRRAGDGAVADEWVARRQRDFRGGGEWVRPLADGRFVRAVERELPDRRFVTLRTDVTELMRAREAAEHASRAKTAFLASTSHEIRTPLNAILGLSYLLEREALPPQAHEHASRIAIAGRTLLGLVNNVLDLSKIEAGQFELEEQAFDLRGLVESEMPLLSAGSANKRLQTRVRVADDVPAVVTGDATRVRQVLTNLLGNALKFTERGTVELDVRRGGRPPAIVFEVRDSGIGIDAATRARLFRPYEQGDASVSRRYGGTGLGLSITAHLVQLMQGSITLDSEPGHGSCFTVTLPLPEPDAPPAAPREPGSVRLLVTCADDARRRTLQGLAAALGWHCEAAADGAAAAARLTAAQADGRPFDVCVTDAGRPAAEDGAGRAWAASVPAAAWPVTLGVGADRAPAGAGAVLTEPLTGSALHDAVSRALQVRRAGAARLRETPPGHDSERLWLPGLRLLVVDDSSLNLDVARKVLELEGASVVTCTGGEQALQTLRQADPRFDAVLLDVQMPGMDGLAVVRTLRAWPGFHRLPVVALSAGVLKQERESALAAGMSEFLPKPLEPARLVACLRGLVERERGAAVPVAPRAATERAADARPRLDIAGIDDDAITLALRQDRALLLSLIGRLVTDLQGLPDIEAADLPSRLHRLRGGAQVVGAMALADAALRLETALRGADARETGRSRRAFDRAATALAEASRNCLAAEEARLTRLRDQEALDAASAGGPLDEQALHELRALLESQSTRAAHRVEQLAGPLLRTIGPEPLRRLRSALAEFDFSAARAMLVGSGVPR